MYALAVRVTRLFHAIDALSGAIVGFALLAGTRAFMFIALVGWRDPVLGGAGLMLLALVGWLRWRCANTSRCDGRRKPRHAKCSYS